jgi:hypothetical protein
MFSSTLGGNAALALNARTRRRLNTEYRKTVPRSAKGIPLYSFGTWLYHHALFLIAIAPQYEIDRLPSEQEIQGFAMILRSYALLPKKPIQEI